MLKLNYVTTSRHKVNQYMCAASLYRQSEFLADYSNDVVQIDIDHCIKMNYVRDKI